MSVLFYKRPDYVAKGEGPLNYSSCQKLAEKAACSAASIPKSLSFDRLMENKTLPPCSLQDFLDYLIYVAHDAENLQFYLWLKDYTGRFNNLPRSQQNLSPEWEASTLAPDLKIPGSRSIYEEEDRLGAEGEDDYPSNLKNMAAAIGTRQQSPPGRLSKDLKQTSDVTFLRSETPSSRRSLDWNEFNKQPFRDEVSQIITHYLIPNSPRELNLSHKTRAQALHALHRTTHPSALFPIQTLISLTLRHHAHPNFIRWSLCNGNKPRVLLLRTIAVSVLTIWAASVAVLILSSKPRWARIGVAPLLWFGITNLIAAAKGLCVVLHRRHTREAHPWELVPEETGGPDQMFGEELAQGYKPGASSRTTVRRVRTESTSSLVPPSLSTPAPLASRPSIDQGLAIDLEAMPAMPGRTPALRVSPLGPENGYQRQEVLGAWSRMSWWQKVRVRKVWMKEEGLRVMQNRIVVQAELWALLATVVATVGVCAAPVVEAY